MDSRQRRYNARYRRRQQERRRAIVILGLILLSLCILSLTIFKLITKNKESSQVQKVLADEPVSFVGAPPIDVKLLSINEYSRPSVAMKEVKGIVIHYTANPGSTAENNRNYFEGLKDSHKTKASSHFVVGLEGEIVQCIPTNEMAYASNDRNKDTIAIESCHPDDTGKFNEPTYESVVRLTGWLCERFGLSSEEVIRHYDVTGKVCPKYFVEDEASWKQFKKDVEQHIKVVKEEKEAAG